MIDIIAKNLEELRRICGRHHVKTLFLFGSAAKESFSDKSDLDFLVQFDSSLNLLDYADNFFSLLENLQQLYNRKVDLLSVSSIKNPILREEIDNTKIILYAA
jgi:hypothetical protein